MVGLFQQARSLITDNDAAKATEQMKMWDVSQTSDS